MAQAFEVGDPTPEVVATTPVEETTAQEAPIEEVPSTPEAPVEETAAPVEEDAFAYARDLASKNAAADDATRSIGE